MQRHGTVGIGGNDRILGRLGPMDPIRTAAWRDVSGGTRPHQHLIEPTLPVFALVEQHREAPLVAGHQDIRFLPAMADQVEIGPILSNVVDEGRLSMA